MGTHVADTVEEIAGLAARGRIAKVPRKRDILEIKEAWASIRDLLPDEPRRRAVDDWIEQVDFHGPIMGARLFEAVVKYGLWYEGYSFAR